MDFSGDNAMYIDEYEQAVTKWEKRLGREVAEKIVYEVKLLAESRDGHLSQVSR